jgi:hypothetical protein
MSGTATPTPASEWKVEEEEAVTLPSGNVATLKRPQLSVLVRHGEVPEELLQAAGALASGEAPDDLATAVQLTDLLISFAFVDPKVAFEGDGGGLSIEALADQDKIFVAAWIKGDVETMAAIRGRALRLVEGGE